MDFRVRGESFEGADRRYEELVRQRDAGGMSEEEFETQRQRLMVRDADGRWWAKVGSAGEWHRREGGDWVREDPPGYRRAAGGQSSAQGTSFGDGGTRRRSFLFGRLLVGLLALVVLGAVLLVGLPYLEGVPGVGDLLGDSRGGTETEGQGAGAQGVAFDAIFVHRASPGNVSANSTYIDNPLTNGNPDAVIVVTPNWNPGGRGGTYNDRAIGVWYDGNRKRWAIFNQDRRAMNENVAFNVAVRERGQAGGR